MPISKPIPLRLSDDLLKRLDAAAQKLGYSRAQLIRYLLVRWLEYFEARRGNVAMPPDIEEVLRLQDGNACRYEIPGGALALNETASSSAGTSRP